jgi:hypothetical protein
LRDSCSEDSEILANVQPGELIQIRHAVNGEATPCYSVVVTQAGREVQGFVLGSSLPAIQEFERTRALESRVIIPAPPESAAKAEKKAPPPVGPPFEPWSGVDTNGKRMQIVPGKAKATLVVFWNAGSRPAERLVHEVMKTESEFGPKGLRAFGLVGAASAGRANYYLDDMGLDYPQALDQQRLAMKYNADPAKGTTLVVDSSNNVVTISSNPAEIRAAVARLLSSE